MVCIAHRVVCIVHMIVCIADEIVCIVHVIVCIAHRVVYIAHGVVCVAHVIVCIAHGVCVLYMMYVCIAHEVRGCVSFGGLVFAVVAVSVEPVETEEWCLSFWVHPMKDEECGEF